MAKKTENRGNISGGQLLVLLLVISLMTTAVEAATGTVDISLVYQELEGFGASGAFYENWLTAHPKKNEIYDVIFEQLGLDIYRLRNTYNIDSGSIDNSAQIVAAAKLRNPMIKIMISSWSPPASLKSNDNRREGTLKKDAYGNYMYDEFADWWADSLADFAAHNIIADYVSIQNEPDFTTPDWDTCEFIPTETTDLAGYDQAFEAVYQELDSRMSELPKLLAPETAGFIGFQSYIDAFIDTNHAYGYAHHLYNSTSGGSYSSPDSFITNMQYYASLYNYKPLFQTEYSRNSDFTDAMYTARHIHNSLVYEGVCAYFYWDLFWESPKGLVSLDYPWGNPSASYTINPVYYAFKQYSAFTDPSWSRVEASTDSGSLRISAFKSPDNTKLTIVIINIAAGGISLSLSLEDFSQTSSAVYRTSATENTAYIGTFIEPGPLTLPARSITTISLTGNSSPDFSNCAEALAAGYGLTSDISGDCYVNYEDIEIITSYWLSNRCGWPNNYCDGGDFEPKDSDVDFFDFSTFASQWMQCNDPEGAGCIENW
jgi:glucuronoarabinoxylan endo-1,4-beta-xylanase